MIETTYHNEVYIIDRNIEDLKVGDLVTTIMGKYGVILGFGKHPDFQKYKTKYYYVLIENEIYHYLPHSIIKQSK